MPDVAEILSGENYTHMMDALDITVEAREDFMAVAIASYELSKAMTPHPRRAKVRFQ